MRFWRTQLVFVRRWRLLYALMFPRQPPTLLRTLETRQTAEWLCLQPSRIEFFLARASSSIGPYGIGSALVYLGQKGEIARVPAWVFKKSLEGNPDLAHCSAFWPNLPPAHARVLVDWACAVAMKTALVRYMTPCDSHARKYWRPYWQAATQILDRAFMFDWRASRRSIYVLYRTLYRTDLDRRPILIALLLLRMLHAEEIQWFYPDILSAATVAGGRWAHILQVIAENPDVPSEFLIARLKESNWSPIEATAYCYREEIRRYPQVRRRMFEQGVLDSPELLAILFREAPKDELAIYFRALVMRWPEEAAAILQDPESMPTHITRDMLLPALTSPNSKLRTAAVLAVSRI